jgi:hypothetical protein
MTALRWFLPRSCAASNHPFGSHFPDKSRPALPRGGKEVQSRLNKLQPSTTTIPALRSKPKLRGAEHSIAARSCSGDFGVRRSAPLWTGVNRATRPYYFSNCFRIVSVLIVTAPPFIRRSLRPAHRRIFPVLLPAERSQVEKGPDAP